MHEGPPYFPEHRMEEYAWFIVPGTCSHCYGSGSDVHFIVSISALFALRSSFRVYFIGPESLASLKYCGCSAFGEAF